MTTTRFVHRFGRVTGLLERSVEDAASWTMAVFGLTALLLGVLGLLWPHATLELLDLEAVEADLRRDHDYTLAFVTASSMAAINMGAYYVLAARVGWRAFYRWTVPFRCLTASVFTTAVLVGRAPIGFLGVALWELFGALATAAALRRDWRRARRLVEADQPSRRWM